MFETPGLVAAHERAKESAKRESAKAQAYSDARQWTVITSSPRGILLCDFRRCYTILCDTVMRCNLPVYLTTLYVTFLPPSLLPFFPPTPNIVPPLPSRFLLASTNPHSPHYHPHSPHSLLSSTAFKGKSIKDSADRSVMLLSEKTG